MMNTYNVQVLSQRYNFSETFFETITNQQLRKTLIEDIQADKDIHIEITQFFYNTDFYSKLEQQLFAKRRELAQIDDFQKRIAVSKNILAIEEEVKAYKVNILDTAFMLIEVKETSTIQMAKDYFFKGQLKLANSLFNAFDLEDTKQKLNAQLLIKTKLQEVYEKLVDNAYEFQVKARLTVLNLDIIQPEDRFQKAIEFFEKGLISIERSNKKDGISSYNFNYASFLHRNNQHQDADKLYKKALNLRRELAKLEPLVYLDSLVIILSNYGVLQGDFNRFDKAEQLHKEELSILQKLKEENAKTKLNSQIAHTLESLAKLEQKRKNFKNADEYYKRALNILQNLVSEDYHKFVLGQTHCLHNYALLKETQKEFDLAEQFFLRAVQSYRDFSKKTSSDIKEYLSTSLKSLGNLYQKKNEFENSKQCYLEALHIKKELTYINPKIHSPSFAMILSDLGKLHSINNDFNNAKSFYEKALKIEEELVDKNPTTFLSNLTTTLTNLASLYFKYKKFKDAIAIYQRVLVYERKMYLETPRIYEPKLVTTLNNLGLAFKDIKEFQKAEQSYEEALNIAKSLSLRDSKIFLPNVAQVYNNIGNLKIETNELEQAESSYKRALIIRRDLAASNPDIYLSYLALTLNNLGVLYKSKNQINQAEQAYLEALEIRKKLAYSHSNTYSPYVATTLNNLGLLYSENDRLQEAKQFYLEAIHFYSKVDINASTITLTNLGLLYLKTNDFLNAEISLKKALNIRKKLALDYQKDYQEEIALTLNYLALANKKMKNLKEAEKLFVEALTIQNQLMANNPKIHFYNFAVIQINFSNYCLEHKKNRKVSFKLLDSAISILLPYYQSSKVQPLLKKAIQKLNNFELDFDKYIEEKIKVLENK